MRLNVSDSFTYRKKSHFTKKMTLILFKRLFLLIKYSLEENDKEIKLPIILLLKLPMAFGHCSFMCFGLKKLTLTTKYICPVIFQISIMS